LHNVDLFFLLCSVLFFFTHTATTQIYTLSLHDALPILDSSTVDFPSTIKPSTGIFSPGLTSNRSLFLISDNGTSWTWLLSSNLRSEEHTSELQSRENLVCRLLLEKKNHTNTSILCPTST